MDDVQAKLFNAVLRKLSKHHLTLQDIFDSPFDYRDASTGRTVVPGFIYYRDTVLFATKNCHLIIQVLFELESEIGPLEKDTQNVLNWMAWFALAWAIDQVITYKEMEEQQGKSHGKSD
jgi:hypothetical protein